MPNWCYNMIAFEGKDKAIQQIEMLFREMAEKERIHEEGQLPKFFKKEEGYFFNIELDDVEEGVIRYETKWSPNSEVVRKIAKRFKVEFVYDYEELGDLLYGRYVYSNGTCNHIYLEGQDFDAFEYDENKDVYHFEGEEHESEYLILETLLERKIKSLAKSIKQ